MNNFRLKDEQMVNGLRRIAWASIFRLMSPCLHVSMSPFSMFFFSCLHVSSCLHVNVAMFQKYCKGKTEQTENSNFPFFAANGKRKRQTSICLLQTETENGSQKFFFLGRQKINSNRRLLFQQTCPSILTIFTNILVTYA